MGEGLKWTQCTFLQESEAGYLPTLSSDTDQSSPLNGTNTLAKSCENEPQTDGSLTCQCGKGTLGCLIHPNTPAEWIAFMQDSLAKTLALLESKQVYKKEPDQGFTEKSCVSLAWYDPATCSWKTYQRSLVTDWEPYSETWPRWGMTVGTCAYAHPMSERRITEIDGLLFATPNTLDSLPPKSPEALHREATVTRSGRSQPSNLRDQVTQLFWPTPNAGDGKNAVVRIRQKSNQTMLGEAIALESPSLTGGTLNPAWVEWLMGFPIGFTNSKDWVTRKSRSKPQPHGNYSEAAE